MLISTGPEIEELTYGIVRKEISCFVLLFLLSYFCLFVAHAHALRWKEPVLFAL